MKLKITLSLLMMLFFFTSIEAAWDGSSTEAFPTSSQSAGSVGYPYLISTPEQLAFIALKVSSGTTYAGKYFRLTEDIDLGGKPWIPIGTVSHPFQGRFDGNNHQIKNLFIDGSGIASTYSKYVGLFGYIKGKSNAVVSEIKNLHIDSNSIIDYVVDCDQAYVGGFVGGTSRGLVSYCTFSGTVNVKCESNYSMCYVEVGGIVGISGMSIKNCVNEGRVNCDGQYKVLLGGIAGSSIGANYCINSGSVSGTGVNPSVGGIMGDIVNGTVDYCSNFGSVNCVSPYDYGYACAGGISGNSSGSVNNSLNSGDVFCKSMSAGSAGGILGGTNVNATITSCTNTGNIKGDATFYSEVGGISGEAISSAEFLYCVNSGIISSISSSANDKYHAYAGGIIGNSSSSTIQCINSGYVSADGAIAYKGGIVGYMRYGNSDNSFYDTQLCPLDYGIGYQAEYKVPNSDGANGKLTSEMVGTALQPFFSKEGDWEYADALYPQAHTVAGEDVSLVAAAPMFLDSNETIDLIVKKNDAMDLYLGGSSVEWESAQGNIDVDANTIVDSGADTLKVVYQGYNRNLIKRMIPLRSCVPSEIDTVATAVGSFTWNGETYTSTPAIAPKMVYTNAAGCDSTILLDLTVYSLNNPNAIEEAAIDESKSDFALMPNTLNAGEKINVRHSFIGDELRDVDVEVINSVGAVISTSKVATSDVFSMEGPKSGGVYIVRMTKGTEVVFADKLLVK